jgi:hypothetical protein
MPCYVADVDACEGKITQDHYLSRTAIEAFSTRPTVRGAAWLPEGEARPIGIGSFTAGILCEKHNNNLSPVDETLGELQRFAEEAHAFFNDDADKRTELRAQFDGRLVERAFLKLICGFTYSGTFTSIPGRPPPTGIVAARKQHLLRALLGREPLDGVGGLYSSPPLFNMARIASFNIQCAVNDDNEVIGANILLRHLCFPIALDRGTPLTAVRFRPPSIAWRNEQNTKTATLSLEWADDGEASSSA